MPTEPSDQDRDLHLALKNRFGFDTFRPGQERVIETLLAGRSALAVFPTGSGKSLCYQFPALMTGGLTLVISPLVALMKDQVDALTSKGIAAARLDSSLDTQEFLKVNDALKNGRLTILYIAPERLANPRFLDMLGRLDISLLAVDEAHCISEWGHNFRPDYLKIAKIADELKIGRRLALTATATPAVAQDICNRFSILESDHVQTGFERPNLSLRISPTPGESKRKLLAEKLRGHEGPSIVYVTHQRTSEEVADSLKRDGIPARAYHAGMRAEDRAEVQEGFMSGSVQTVVATIAFGMGIDKSNIRAIYHYNLPKSLENYVQETGRAGRDGKPSTCEMLACQDDRIALENFVFGDTPTPSSIKSLVERVLLQGEHIEFSHYQLSRSLDIRPLVVETVLTYLELDGFIRPTGSNFTTYKIRPVRTIDQIASGHKAERADFLKRLFSAGKMGRSLITLNVSEAAGAIGESESRIRRALTWLEEAGDIGLQPSGLVHTYQRLVAREGLALGEIVRDLQEKFAERESREIARIDRVLDLAGSSGCLTAQVLRYFGENPEADCGTCSNCLSDSGPQPVPGREPVEISAEDMAIVRSVCDENHSSLRSPRQLARFFCGINSPAASAARLGRHDHFGHFSNWPFPDVLALTESVVL